MIKSSGGPDIGRTWSRLREKKGGPGACSKSNYLVSVLFKIIASNMLRVVRSFGIKFGLAVFLHAEMPTLCNSRQGLTSPCRSMGLTSSRVGPTSASSPWSPSTSGRWLFLFYPPPLIGRRHFSNLDEFPHFWETMFHFFPNVFSIFLSSEI